MVHTCLYVKQATHIQFPSAAVNHQQHSTSTQVAVILSTLSGIISRTMMKTAFLALALASPFATASKADDACSKAHDAVYEAWGNGYIGGMQKEKDKVPGLVDTCMDKCPQPYYAQCAMFKDHVEYDEIDEECKKPYDDMHTAFAEMAYEGDKDVAKTFPDLVKKCGDACKGDKRVYDECVAFEGIDESTDFEEFIIDFGDYGLEAHDYDYVKLSDECEDALDKLYTAEDEFLIKKKEPSDEDSKELAKLSDACSKVCPDSKFLCALITESDYWHLDAPVVIADSA